MSCGKKPFIKKWDKPKNIKIIKPSPYEQNEASVKRHWKIVLRCLEQSFKGDQSQYEAVRDLLDPVIFQRITKIFNLPAESKKYEPPERELTPLPSDQFYDSTLYSNLQRHRSRITFSTNDFQRPVSEMQARVLSEHWTITSHRTSEYKKLIRSRSTTKSKTSKLSEAVTKSDRSFPKFTSRRVQSKKSKIATSESASDDTPPESDDDLKVHPSGTERTLQTQKNPHYDFLYCNESEADMIKWNSKFKQTDFEMSASDQFNKKAEIATKKIASEFFDWWSKLGTGEFKSEIKRPQDIEDLFQVWFDEHASRSLVLNPKILPCVKQSVASYVRVPKVACPKVLKRQISSDISAETGPAHKYAFGTCLPQHMKHIPPRNNTTKIWHNVRIPDELKTMSYIWEDIQHLTSTKTFHAWLKQRPNLKMPPFLQSLDQSGEKKELFVVPSDYVVKEKLSAVENNLSFPVSKFSLEIKKELSKIMND